MSFDLKLAAGDADADGAQRAGGGGEGDGRRATAGGGMVTVVATRRGEIKEIRIDPKAIDPSDPELLGDLVTAAVNEALRAAHADRRRRSGRCCRRDLGGLLPGL